MNFSDPLFIFLFLPLVWLGWLVASYVSRGVIAPIVWVTLASIVFYGWWHVDNVAVMLGSMLFNYALGWGLDRTRAAGLRRVLLSVGLAANLGLLMLFKYAHFVLGMKLNLVLPLAISFFTFHQISYLVDIYRGMKAETNLAKFTFYVTFFPHLIAGPVLNFRDISPQLPDFTARRLRAGDLADGFSRFLIGLAKKLLIADVLAPLVDAAYSFSDNGREMGAAIAWGAALGFYFQIYFDFSGYTDMALGLARMFGVGLPENFAHPYRAASPIDFWRRWHITLSAFLRNYLYIPLGGNRHGLPRQMGALGLTMLLGGLWHGAGWNFLTWGALHGAALIANHLGRRARAGEPVRASFAGVVLTQLFVALAWVPFRAGSLSAAGKLLRAMIPLDGVRWSELVELARTTRLPIPQSYLTKWGSVTPEAASVVWLSIVLATAMLITWPVAGAVAGALGRTGRLRPARGEPVWRGLGYVGLHAAVFGALAVRIIESSIVQPFIYFQF